ncbi:FAD-binding domain-containing protein [Mycena venus]|uniref:FAD-binding domain-containing protein n=1 Tax=Mycena venus TaxID=2733690 RepID=A0A8H6XXW4_9AGAR|nr:FAD-binding domain-containing protein [Mycena venus]
MIRRRHPTAIKFQHPTRAAYICAQWRRGPPSAPKMRPSVFTFALFFALCPTLCRARSRCRNVPGSAGFPHASGWQALNESVSGRLVAAVPSAKYCASLPTGACTDAQWKSALFRNTIPGAMNQVNYEQGYDLTPPSLCLRNSTTCGQGDVPIYSVEAETVEDVQATVRFATAHDLRLVVKSSGHDYLGRSTAPNSLLRMVKFTGIAFTDAFTVGGQDMGSAVTVGPGVYMQDIYQQTKAHGKIIVGGSAATVCAAGGYLQGAGHSSLGPLFGMAADNVLEFEVVLASGKVLKVNSKSHPDLFFAMRGGGAGSWGVIISATVRTHPTFNVTGSIIELGAANHTAAATLAAVHAQHIFDFDPVAGGQYFFLQNTGAANNSSTSVLIISSVLPNTTLEQGTEMLAPFLDDALAVPGVSLISKDFANTVINDALYNADDSVGASMVMGSRLVPAAAYRALHHHTKGTSV